VDAYRAPTVTGRITAQRAGHGCTTRLTWRASRGLIARLPTLLESARTGVLVEVHESGRFEILGHSPLHFRRSRTCLGGLAGPAAGVALPRLCELYLTDLTSSLESNARITTVIAWLARRISRYRGLAQAVGGGVVPASDGLARTLPSLVSRCGGLGLARGGCALRCCLSCRGGLLVEVGVTVLDRLVCYGPSLRRGGANIVGIVLVVPGVAAVVPGGEVMQERRPKIAVCMPRHDESIARGLAGVRGWLDRVTWCHRCADGACWSCRPTRYNSAASCRYGAESYGEQRYTDPPRNGATARWACHCWRCGVRGAASARRVASSGRLAHRSQIGTPPSTGCGMVNVARFSQYANYSHTVERSDCGTAARFDCITLAPLG